MSYLGNNPEIDASINKYEYTATAGQTTFSATYDQRVDVYLNGVLLSSSDYTATSGTDIVLSTGATSGDIVQIDAYVNAAVSDIASQTGNSGKYLTTNGSTTSWGEVSANSTTYGLFEHANTISADYTITSGNNAGTFGAITIDSGVTVTVPSGSVWTIV